MKSSWAVVVCALAFVACQEADTSEGLKQRPAAPQLVLGEDVVAPDGSDTVDDTGDTSGDTSGDTGDTQDTVDTLDTTDTRPDTGPVACVDDGDCEGFGCKVGHCSRGICELRDAPDNAECDDGNPCTTIDRCTGGECFGSGALDCRDGDPCTEDRCAEGDGCEHPAVVCDDDNACTSDSCKPGVGCVSAPLVCPAPADPCKEARCDVTDGCGEGPREDGAACDDGDPCTVEACSGGQCKAEPVGCDDNNPCTSDACVAEVGCVSTAIPGCANDPACIGRLDGASCDDGNPATSADMCILGSCRGYVLTRIPGSTVADQQGLVVTETDFGPDGWSAVFWTEDLTFNQQFTLARISDPAAPFVYTATTGDQYFAGLHDGFVGDDNGVLWRFSGAAWQSNNVWNDALEVSGASEVNALVTLRDTTQGGAVGRRRMWIGGNDFGSEWVRYCREEANGAITCSKQELDDFDDASIPMALAGAPICNASGVCTSAALIVGADASGGGGSYYTDIYTNVTGTSATWVQGVVPEQAASRRTRAATAWGNGNAAQFMVVGTRGYVVHRRSDGTWKTTLSLKESQSSRDFTGVWEGAGVVVMAAYRTGGNNQTVAELWVAPSSSDVEQGSSWVIHELGRTPNVDADGVYDVHGRATGEIRAVGAVRRTNGVVGWLDGAVWVRTP